MLLYQYNTHRTVLYSLEHLLNEVFLSARFITALNHTLYIYVLYIQLQCFCVNLLNGNLTTHSS